MHIVYAVTTCSENTYRALFSHSAQKPAFQSQKYHRLLIEGLAQGAKVDVVATLPVNRQNCTKGYLHPKEEAEGGAQYHYVPASCHGPVKLILGAFGTFRRVFRLCKEKDSVVFVDCLNCTTAFFAQLASRMRGVRCVGIITDLPDMLGYNRVYRNLTNRVIARCTDYVLLTEMMNARLNPAGKPHIILEGHADISMGEKKPGLDKKQSPRVCLYAGSVCTLYGLPELVEGFQKANLPNTILAIYGPGDYAEPLQTIAREDPRIFYGGMLLSSQVVEKEMQATLLVNPRPTKEEYVKYSFPSKTMEYMASGTPVLTTRLPGMPREYYPYVHFIDEETPEGIAQALKTVLSQSDEALFAQGMNAREFVLESRNNVVQAGKILTMLEQTKRS